MQVSNISPQHIADNIGAIFAQLNQQEVEEFYFGYQYWNLQRQIEFLQMRLADFRKQILENAERMQEVQPTAIELAILARLQSTGVSDIDLLDRMLERGELWLDRTMQRLDYLEQLDDFISDDYTQWCQHALEGAYDWIDTVLDGTVTSQPSTVTTSNMKEDVQEEELIEATEELFLQKISTDEDELLMQEITMKRPAIPTAQPSESLSPSEEIPVALEVAPNIEEATPIQEEVFPEDATLASALPVAIDFTQEHVEADDRKEIETHTSATIPETHEQQQKNELAKRPGFISRSIAKIWGSRHKSYSS
jgi:hypothetical protein